MTRFLSINLLYVRLGKIKWALGDLEYQQETYKYFSCVNTWLIYLI